MSVPATPHQLNILIVDDNADFAQSLCVLLTSWGHRCRTAGEGEKALAAAREEVPDVIVMDLLMPHMHGIEATRALRAEPFGAQLVIIAMSAWAQHFEGAEFESAGFDHQLMKPVKHHVLEALLATCPDKVVR